MDGLAVATNIGIERWREVDAALRRLAACKGGYDAEEARWLRAGRDIGVHLYHGFATYLEYLERVLGYPPRLAAERLRVADALGYLPEIENALAGGALSWCAVRELVRVARPDTQQSWLATARGRTVREVEALVAGLRPGDQPGDRADPALMEKVLRLELSAETYALYREARRLVQEETGSSLSDDEVLAELCRAVLGGSDEPGRATHQIAVTVCSQCAQATVDGAGEALPVGPATLAQARCDAQEVGPTHVGRPERARQEIPPATRRLVLRRDHHNCTVPGCRSSRYLQIHHIAWRTDGGKNEPSNLTAVCGSHHRLLHDGGLRVEGTAPDGLRFLHDDGRPYGAKTKQNGVTDDTLVALRKLGFKDGEARGALARARTHVGLDASVETLLREALRALVPSREIAPP